MNSLKQRTPTCKRLKQGIDLRVKKPEAQSFVYIYIILIIINNKKKYEFFSLFSFSLFFPFIGWSVLTLFDFYESIVTLNDSALKIPPRLVRTDLI